MDDQLHAAAVIEEAFGDDTVLRGDDAEGGFAGLDVELGLFGGGGVEAGADPEGLLDTLTAEGGPALFLRGEVYGTRASTVVTVTHQGAVRFIERTWGWSDTGPVCSAERQLDL